MSEPNDIPILHVALTADVDPDANRPAAGRPDAVGPGGGEPTVTACLEGLGLLVDLLAAHGMPATLFWEGRTLEALAEREPNLLGRAAAAPSLEHGCHGWRHEDFAGTVSGRPLGAGETAAALDEAERAFQAAFGRRPLGFRAPYCRTTPELARVLAERGYDYDASRTVDPVAGDALVPRRLAGEAGPWELPLCRGRDPRGRPMSGYLWQLLEGARDPGDYLHLVAWARERCPGGLLQFAFHPWHLVVSAEGERFGGGAAWLRFTDLIAALRTVDGVAFTTCGAYLAGRLLQAPEPPAV